MKKNMVYFVLYVVLLTELLVVITERDELEAKDHEIRDKMINTLAESYKQPLLLTIPQKHSDYNLASKEALNVVLTPAGLVSDEEKKDLKFYVDVDPSSSRPANWPQGGITFEKGNEQFKLYRQNGNAVFSAKISNAGEFKFKAYCETEREFPSYLPDYLMDSLKVRVGNLKMARSDKEDFSITAKALGGVETKKAEIFF